MVAESLKAPASADDETALVVAAQGGDLGAFERLVERYERRLFRLAERITSNAEDAEDVVQESFLKAYTKLAQFQRNSRFYTWIVRITVNEALMRLRKHKGSRMVSLDDDIQTEDGLIPREVEDWHPNPEQQYTRQEVQGILQRAIQSLALPYRAVFQLRDVEEFSTEETAQALAISVPAVKSRLLRARLQLREKLNRYFKKHREAVSI